MKTYRVSRYFTRSEYQFVKANSPEEAEEIAENQSEKFIPYWGTELADDADWDYKVDLENK